MSYHFLKGLEWPLWGARGRPPHIMRETALSPPPCTRSPGSNSPFRKPSAPGNPGGRKTRSETRAPPSLKPPSPAPPGTWLWVGLREDPSSQTTVAVAIAQACRKAVGGGLVGEGQGAGGWGRVNCSRRDGGAQTDRLTQRQFREGLPQSCPCRQLRGTGQLQEAMPPPTPGTSSPPAQSSLYSNLRQDPPHRLAGSVWPSA